MKIENKIKISSRSGKNVAHTTTTTYSNRHKAQYTFHIFKNAHCNVWLVRFYSFWVFVGCAPIVCMCIVACRCSLFSWSFADSVPRIGLLCAFITVVISHLFKPTLKNKNSSFNEFIAINSLFECLRFAFSSLSRDASVPVHVFHLWMTFFWRLCLTHAKIILHSKSSSTNRQKNGLDLLKMDFARI